MSVQIESFSDELTKLAKGRILSYVAKHPMNALGAGFIAIPAVMAGVSGAKRGRVLGKAERFLLASKNGPSRAFYTNYNRMLGRKKLSPRELRRLHWNYNRKTYRK